MARAAKHFNVRPRYTPGSPAMVSEEIALHVAAGEKMAHEHALSGVYGTEETERARREGLLGIAESVVERRKGWEVHDLITGETYTRPFPNPKGRARR